MTVVTVFIALLYPLAIWLGQGRVEPRFLAVLLLCAALTGLHALKVRHAWRWWLGGTLLLALYTVWTNALLPLKLYPAFVNAAMLGLFGYSLIFPPSMAERFARLRDANFPVEAIGYTRQVTQVWCVFFAVNGAIALTTALWASAAVWSLYNGLIAYLLMGFLFAGEYFVRGHFKRRHHV